jgi:hypothetical protein
MNRISLPFRWLIFLLLSLAGCSQKPVTPTTVLTPRIWKVEYTPSLSWIEPILNACTMQIPGTGIVVDQQPFINLHPEQVEVTLYWGEKSGLKGAAAVIGTDELVIIVNPKNPLQKLDQETLSAIFTGDIHNWAETNNPESFSGVIEVWEYPQGNEIHNFFVRALAISKINSYSKLAPDPRAMKEVISKNPNAIGYLPKRWLDGSVKTVDNIDSNQKWVQPILAISPTEPQGDLRIWVVCLQTAIQATK